MCETERVTVSGHTSGAIQPKIGYDSFSGRRKSNIMVEGLVGILCEFLGCYMAMRWVVQR